MYTQDVKDYLDEVLFTMVVEFIEHDVEFKLVVKDDDVWDKPLPESVKEKCKEGYMLLQVTGQSLEDSFYDVETDIITLVTGFEGLAFHRTLNPYDILGIVDYETGRDLMVKPFTSSAPKVLDLTEKQTIENVLKTYDDDEITDSVVTSLTAIKYYNEDLFED